VGCTTVRIKFVQEDYYRTDFLVDDIAFCASALETDPDEYDRIPIKSGALKSSLGVKRRRDKRSIHYDFRLAWNHGAKTMYDKMKVLQFAEERLFFIDGEVPQLVEENTIYDNATYNYVGITNPSGTHAAYTDSGSALPAAFDDYDTTEIATLDYQEIDADDANYNETTNPADGEYLWHRFHFISAITGDSIQRFRVKVKASSNDSSLRNYDGCVLYAWDGTNWDEIERTTNDSINELEFSTADSTISQQYVDATGNIYLLLRSRAARNGTDNLDLRTYYAEVEINDGLDLVITPTHRPRFPNNDVFTDWTVKNKTTGATLIHSIDFTYDRDTTEVTLLGGSSGDIIEITYERYWEVEIAELSETWLRGDPADDRDRHIEMILRTVTGSI